MLALRTLPFRTINLETQCWLLRVYSWFLEFSTSELIPDRKGVLNVSSYATQSGSGHGPQSKSLWCLLTQAWGICPSASASHCPPSPPLSKLLTAIAAEIFSFFLHLSPSCFTFPPHAFRSANLSCSKMGFIFCLCLLWSSHYLNLSSLHLRVYHSSHLAAFTAVIHLTLANTQQHPLPSPLPVPLIKLTLHGCLVPNTGHLLWVFLAKHSFSSWFVWNFVPPEQFTLFFSLLSHFPKDLIPSVYGDRFAKCLFDSLCLCGFPLNHKAPD